MTNPVQQLADILSALELNGWTVTTHIARLELTHEDDINTSHFLTWSQDQSRWVVTVYHW